MGVLNHLNKKIMDKKEFAIECVRANMPISEADKWWQWASEGTSKGTDIMEMSTYDFLYDPSEKQQATYAANAVSKVAPKVADLVKMSSKDLLRTPRLGAKGLAYVIERLRKHNLNLGAR